MAVVERLEAVDVEDHEREGLPVARGAVDLLGQARGEGAAVAQARQRVVVGQEAHLLERAPPRRPRSSPGWRTCAAPAGARVEGSSRSSGSSAQMTPDERPSRSCSGMSSQWWFQAQRAAAVARRLVGGALDAQARAGLVAGQQVAALDLELRGRAGARRTSRSPLCEPASSSSGPADDGPRHRARRGLASMSSTETFWKPSAARMPSQTACRIGVDRERLGQAGPRRAAGARARCGGARPRRRPARPARPARRARRAPRAPRRSSSEGRRPETGSSTDMIPSMWPVAVAQRHEERVLGVPRVGGVGHLDVGDEGDRRVPGPVELVPGQEEAAVALEVAGRRAAPIRSTCARARAAPRGPRRSRGRSRRGSRSRPAGRAR